ncbi:histidine phosphatase family protein [Caldimonas sp. KR1-144]|uniref:histidine phosphatase family protein n=1 Tax=Caldimonas sp. KR1-144 TaxID=3400911 RepID=UPI003BFE3404
MASTTACFDAARRRGLILGSLALAGFAHGQSADAAALAALRRGGCVAAFRHANAPGTFDPPGFRLDRCETQRNLDDRGREQSRRLGAWFRAQGLAPTAVRSSPWCRCLETARLAFGDDAVHAWDALGSPRAEGHDAQRQQAELRAALARVPAGRFEVWVSHQFTLSALVGGGTASAEGLLLRANDGRVELVGRIAPA